MTVALLLIVVAVGYILGAMPFGLLVARAFANRDVRQVGSGKIGMTNVMRTAGKKAGLVSLLLDMGKAAAAVFIAEAVFSSHTAIVAGAVPWTHLAQVLAAMAAISGHSWSIFLKFKGGRGVAAFIGGLLAVYWPAAVAGGGLMLIIGFRTKYMSLGSIIGAVSAFIMTMSTSILNVKFFLPNPPIEYVTYTMICAIFIYAMHRDNIIRLMSGTERRIGEKTTPEVSPSSSHAK